MKNVGLRVVHAMNLGAERRLLQERKIGRKIIWRMIAQRSHKDRKRIAQRHA
jgi:hypothetical protein